MMSKVQAQNYSQPEQALTEIELNEKCATEEDRTQDSASGKFCSSAETPVLVPGITWKGKPLVAASAQECSPTIVQQSTPTNAQLSLHQLSSSSFLYPHSFSTSSSTTSIPTESGYASLSNSCSSVQLKSKMKKNSSQMSFDSAPSSRHVSHGNLHREPLHDFPQFTLTEDSIAEYSSTEEKACFEDTGGQEEQNQDATFREGSEATQVCHELECPSESKLIASTAPPLMKKLMGNLKEEMREEMKEEMKEYCEQILQEKFESMKLESSSTSSFSEQSTGNMPAIERKTCSGSPHSLKCPDALTSSHSCPLLEEKGVQTPENLRKQSDRLHSDSEYMKRVMLRRKPRLSDVPKSHSASDAEDALSMRKLVGSYRQLPEIKDDPLSMVELEEQCKAAVNTQQLDVAESCIDEDLSEEELITVAGHVHPDILCQLAVHLHKNTKCYSDLMHRFAHISASEKAFKILCAWFQDISPGPQNRRTLVDKFCELNQRRVASAIANKDYNILK